MLPKQKGVPLRSAGRGEMGMAEFISVGMGEGYVAKGNDPALVALGLGSCIAICLYDPLAAAGAMAHVMLPNILRDANTPFRFAESAVPALLASLEPAGVVCSRLRVAIAGGAQMFGGNGTPSVLDIGARNVAVAREAIRAAGLMVAAEDVGGNLGRSVTFHVDTGRVVVRTIGQGERDLAAFGSSRHARAGSGAPLAAALSSGSRGAS